MALASKDLISVITARATTWWKAASMRIGTWNMEGRRRQRQTDFLLRQDCDVLLLTEVPDQWSLPGYHLTPGDPDMGPRKRWAAIASRCPLVPVASPHAATAAATV